MGRFQTVTIGAREMGSKISYNLGKIDGGSNCYKALFFVKRVAKSKQKLLDQNFITYS